MSKNAYCCAMNKLRFFLIKLPLIGIISFVICSILAAIIFPGTEKEVIGFKSDYYSFTHNFLSELGGLKTNPNQTNPNIVKEDNTIAMLLFNGNLIFIGLIIILYYYHFKKVFNLKQDTLRARRFATLTTPIGLVSGFLFAGIGAVPFDLHFDAHVFFAHYAFLSLFFLAIFHSLTVYHSKFLNNNYVYGYVLFCILLLIYLYILFFGPIIAPNVVYTESDLMLQVIAQKSIVISFMIAFLHQVYGFSKVLKTER